MTKRSDVPGDIVVFTVAGEICGLPVATVRDVLDDVAAARIPLAPDAIAGHFNLRGRIVTAIELAKRVGCEASNDNPVPRRTAIVVEQELTLYALLVDEVREVLRVLPDQFGPVPSWLAPRWASLATGIVRRDGASLVVLDGARVLSLAEHVA